MRQTLFCDNHLLTFIFHKASFVFHVCWSVYYSLQNPRMMRDYLFVVVFMNSNLLESMTLVEFFGTVIRHLNMEIDPTNLQLRVRARSSQN